MLSNLSKKVQIWSCRGDKTVIFDKGSLFLFLELNHIK